MILKELLQQSIVAGDIPPELGLIEVSGLSSDSRYVEAGDLFFAKQGAQSHGLDFLPALIEKGVAAIIYEDPQNNATAPLNIPALKVENIDALILLNSTKIFNLVLS